MANQIDNEAELELTKAQSVASMHVVGNRCIDSEKLAWVLAYLMEKRPKEQVALKVLAEELHDYLSSSASIVKNIIRDRLAIDIAEMNREA